MKKNELFSVKFLQANNGDCILIKFSDETGKERHILIDGGTGRTYRDSMRSGQLKTAIEELREHKKQIDLLILTHIDDDHIGGLLQWFRNDTEALGMIDKIWFNSGKMLAKYFNTKINPDLEYNISKSDEFNTSITQGIEFSDFISRTGRQNTEIIKRLDTETFHGLKFTFLSPDDTKLEKLVKEWKKEEEFDTSGEPLDYHKTLKELLEDDKFKEDKAYPNGSSFAFIVEVNTDKYLFLGDAHPSVILKSLNDLGYYPDNQIKAKFVKLSHHGSMYNNSPELLDVIDSRNFIISTNGALHGHPHKTMMARIISKFDNCDLYFNYPELIDLIFTAKDLSEYPNFKTHGLEEEIN